MIAIHINSQVILVTSVFPPLFGELSNSEKLTYFPLCFWVLTATISWLLEEKHDIITNIASPF